MDDERPDETPTENVSLLGCLLPTFWMLVGNGILAVCAVSIAAETRAFSAADVVYWITVGCLLSARYADISYYNGRTSQGTPATMSHWRRYAAILVGAATALWVIVHLIPSPELS